MDSAKAAAGGVLSYIAGPGLVPQLLLTITIFIALQFVLSTIEAVMGSLAGVNRQVTVLMPYTTIKQRAISVDDRYNKQIFNSNNERGGMESSYSMWVNIAPETFGQIYEQNQCGQNIASSGVADKRLKHIFHKGSLNIFPLMAPGVFVEADQNTLRVYMNSATNWNNYVVIPNIPVAKWFHLVISIKGKFLDVYINGNVAVRHEFLSVPKLNFGNIYIMSSSVFPDPKLQANASTKEAIAEQDAAYNAASLAPDFKVAGPINGMVSRASYFAYALNYSQIDDLFRQGPSDKLTQQSLAATVGPPYNHDSWWTVRY